MLKPKSLSDTRVNLSESVIPQNSNLELDSLKEKELNYLIPLQTEIAKNGMVKLFYLLYNSDRVDFYDLNLYEGIQRGHNNVVRFSWFRDNYIKNSLANINIECQIGNSPKILFSQITDLLKELVRSQYNIHRILF